MPYGLMKFAGPNGFVTIYMWAQSTHAMGRDTPSQRGIPNSSTLPFPAGLRKAPWKVQLNPCKYLRSPTGMEMKFHSSNSS